VPFEFRHFLEIHAVDGGDDGRRHEYDREHGKELNYVGLG
jgi:hypothetical protein